MVDREAPPRFRSKYPRPPREDGRKQFLVFLKPDLIKRIKSMALDRDEYAFQLVEWILYDGMEYLEDEAQHQPNPTPWIK